MNVPNSPLFPVSSLRVPAGIDNDAEYLMPQLPDTPLAQTSSVQVYIVPTEKQLFVQGFKPVEFEGLPPTLLRGCLVIRVLKATKLRSISLVFKGTQRTEWPEGIPPKKNVYLETIDIVSHTWPFFKMESAQRNCGADLFIPKGHDDISHLSLSDIHTSGLPLVPVESSSSFAANLIKRATSLMDTSQPQPNSLAIPDSMADLTAVLSSLSIVSIADSLKPGYFAPGDYIYNFEHPIPVLTPETTSMTFGKVSYSLEATIVRIGTFKANLFAKLPVEVVRIPSHSSVEENEPIVIEKDWEDQLRYEIVIGSKAVVLDSYVPLAFRFIPLYGKVALHRIRVSMTESANYYSHNKIVHREEPVKKFLLLEHKAKKNKSLLSQNGGMTEAPAEGDDEVLPRELEFQLFVPATVNKKYNYVIHPDTSFDTIKCEHWIKISLRISKQDPNSPDKRKHFEILIDSPIHLCSPLAAHYNTLLPAYDHEPEFLPKYTPTSPPMSPEVTAIDYSHRTAHLLLAVFSPFSGPNGEGTGTAPSRPITPIEFQHISSQVMNDEPIQRDNDVHLEANLYKPEEAQVDALNSPQAQPYSPVASPTLNPTVVGSPVMSRAPSLAPPAFDERTANVEGILPPAYFREDPAKSVSPLAIDRSHEPRSRNGNTSRSIPSMLVQDTSITGIDDALDKQVDILGRNPNADIEFLRSTLSNRSFDSSEDKKSLNVKDNQDGKSLDGSNRSLDIPTNGQTINTKGNSLQRNSTSSLYEADEELPKTYSGLNDDTDITDIKVEGAAPPPAGHPALHLRVEKLKVPSRHSSISLDTMSAETEDPLDQTLPLLSLSTSSLHDGDRLLFDGLSMLDSISDLVDVAQFGHNDFNVNGSLFTLRNPRITKHYQNSPPKDGFEDNFGKPRQKSFGVLPHLDLFRGMTQNHDMTESSGESEMTISAITSANGRKGEAYREPTVDLQQVASK